MVSPVDPLYCDEDYNYIAFEFNMNYSVDGLRYGYSEQRKKEKSKVSDDLLHEMGYSDEDILKSKR